MKLSKEVTKKFPVPNDPDGAFIKIRHLTDNTIDEIVSETSTTKLVGGELVVETNQLARKQLFTKKSLVGWGGFDDADGEELKFTIQNVNRAFEFVIITDDGKKRSFLDWVDDCSVELSKIVEEQKEVAGKN